MLQKKATQLDIAKFKKALSEVDTKMKSLPPTAQVAAQQGEYLAKCFNRMKECEENPEGPIRFRDSGRHHFKPFRGNKDEILGKCLLPLYLVHRRWDNKVVHSKWHNLEKHKVIDGEKKRSKVRESNSSMSVFG
ncbi:putative NADH:ubiquinone reductase (non-electrogenic) [Helianthus anomalus]